MSENKKHKSIGQKARFLKRTVTASAMRITPLRGFVRNRRAVSVVISNLILIAAVIAVGFVVIAWEQGQSATYQQNQSAAINKNINQLQERLSFEYVSYNGTNLNVYVINSGTTNNVNVSSIKIGTNSQLSVTNLYSIGGTAITGLRIGQDGYFTVRTSLTSGTYLVKVTTSRGSNFVTNFAY